ncbi:MAG: nucleotidyl transferase AbiEii/AbiGii toxin family protein [Helicobacter sp.]|uniref:nucleotidyl transferase AbiEii/AbiGii toxin family protein n=1 Tax=Helicobacter sp. TaxID=218 RepID=UPI002A7F0EF0|nr:nucleotidyl transferase AbiEii/AbiGii toxin family protein [Helicobacter sp.]MDY4425874.1 nucleotidyl transferase AbiEii/AbiGii toxin family protein [Helicobacter sp.]
MTLLGLYRGGFFNKAAFYGGTSLRILYGLERFSEDLDFSLLEKNKSFDMEKYFPSIVNEFEALGIEVSLNKKTNQMRQI